MQPTKQDCGDLPEDEKMRLCASCEIMLTTELRNRMASLQVQGLDTRSSLA